MKFNIINFVECIFLYSFDYSINEIAQIKYSNKALAIRKIHKGSATQIYFLFFLLFPCFIFPFLLVR
jgi:hypothetical protein